MYLPPRPRMTPLYDYVLTPQDATPPPSQCNHPAQMRPHLPGTPKSIYSNRCRADLLPRLVSDTEGQLYYYLPSTNRYWSHNLRSMSGTQKHLPSLVTNLHGRCHKQPIIDLACRMTPSLSSPLRMTPLYVLTFKDVFTHPGWPFYALTHQGCQCSGDQGPLCPH